VSAERVAEIEELQPFAHLPQRLQWARPRRVSHDTIGQLYEAIAGGFLEVPNVIIGAAAAQIDGTVVDFPTVVKVASRDDALRGIELIISQGEGTKRDTMDSHYGVFLNIYNQYQALRAKDPEFDPVRPVASNPLSRLHVDNTWPGWRLIDDPTTRRANDLCSSVYETMLLMLYRFFATDGAMVETQRTLARSFIRVMTGVIKALGEALTQMPMGAETPGRTAGPSFEVNRTIQLVPQERAAWIGIYERLLRDAEGARALSIDPAVASERVSAALARAAISLQQIAEGFGDQPPHGSRGHHGSQS
jgi:hypothetical protein